MFPLGLVCGNTYVMKPSEQDPGPCMLLMKLALEAGLPDGVLNVIHGQKEAVDALCDSPHIRAISFVGGDRVGKYIYERGSANGKRVQANMVSIQRNLYGGNEVLSFIEGVPFLKVLH